MIVLGRLTAPYGVRGWLRVACFGDDPLSWKRMPVWWLGPEQGPWQERRMVDCRLHGATLTVKFEGVEDRSAAETLVGQFVAAPREALPQPDEDEFYWSDLVGLAVVNQDGVNLGTVAEVMSPGPQEVLRVVDQAGMERLLPFVRSVVRSVEVAERQMRVEWGPDW